MSARNPVADAPRDSALERRLAAALTGTRLGRPLYGFQRVGSTMDVAKALAEEGAPEGALVWAARQDHGRGRLGRVWESPEGGAYLSLVLRPMRPPAEVPQLSLVAGLSAAEAIRELTTLSPSIRWPNDLLLNGRKVAGILIEASTVRSEGRRQKTEGKKDDVPYVVVGIGINVATDPKDLPDTATSLAASGAACGPHHLTAVLCSKVDGWYDIWTAKGFTPIRESLCPWLNLGGLVRLTIGGSQVEGQAMDVDEEGRLLVRLESGVVKTFEAGEVTLLR